MRIGTFLPCLNRSAVPTALLGQVFVIAHGLKPMATISAAPTELSKVQALSWYHISLAPIIDFLIFTIAVSIHKLASNPSAVGMADLVTVGFNLRTTRQHPSRKSPVGNKR